MICLKTLQDYSDQNGNSIRFAGKARGEFLVEFRGSNNRLVIHDAAHMTFLRVFFDADDGSCEIGRNSFKGHVRIGQDGRLVVGDGVTATGHVYVTAAEGTSVTIGRDCMFAMGVELRADDSHPIFDVDTGQRVNPSRSIEVGEHVWLGQRSTVLGGSWIGEGSVLGFGAILKGRVPNNCVAAGVPARVVRRNVAWERPHLSLHKPFYKPDASVLTRSDYWKPTVEEAGEPAVAEPMPPAPGGLRGSLGAVLGALSRRLLAGS